MRIDNPTGFTSNLTGSFTGSFVGDGTGLVGVTGEWDGTLNGNATITGSLTVSSSIVDFSNTTSISGSKFTGSSFTGSFVGDGSGLTGVNTGSWDGVYSGSAEITGSLRITGSLDTTGDAVFGGSVSGSNLSGTNTGDQTNITGNAGTATLAAGATILETARNINSVAFDGSADITIVDATKLPLAGGTLTGALIVENNAITQDGTRPILTLQQSGTTKVFLGISSGASDLVIGDASGDAVFRKPASSGAFRFSVDGGTSSAFTISSTGAATFVGGVQAASFTSFTNSTYFATNNIYGIGYNFATSEVSDGVTYSITGGAAGTAGNFFSWKTQTGGGTPTEKLRISSTGAATFSGLVTADGFEVGNGEYFKARRLSSNVLLDLLGIESGTDNTRLLITGDFNIKNGGLATLFNMTTTGAATFSSSVTAGGTITQTSSSVTLLLNRTGGTTFGAGVQYQTSGTNNWIAGTGQATVGTDYSIYNYNTGTGAINITYATNNVQIGGTADAGYKLDVDGQSRVKGKFIVEQASGGGLRKQVLTGQITAAASGVSKKIAYVGYTHSITVHLYADQAANSGMTAIASFTTVYGNSTGGITQSSTTQGNVSGITVSYNNGGSPAYTIDVSVTYANYAPIIYYVIEGINNDNNIYSL